MQASSLRLWYQVHKWTSLICTIFLLILCLTGLPLIFHDELSPQARPAATGMPLAGLNEIMASAKKSRPGEVVLYVTEPLEENNTISVTMGASTAVPADSMHLVVLDAHTAQVVDHGSRSRGIIDFILELHTDLFAGSPGRLFLGVMALLFLAATISGVVLYAPFMRRLPFGSMRFAAARRVRWLDLHNLLGVTTVAWVLVVGVTGGINTLGTFVAGYWQSTELAAMIAPYRDQPLPQELSSMQAAVYLARREEPGMTLSTVAFPGTPFAGKHHYGVYLRGNTPLTSRLLKPLLIDAETGQLTAKRDMPWYVKCLFISEPLHFGDYGGMPLKLLWAGFDVVTIGVLISGLCLWRLRS